MNGFLSIGQVPLQRWPSLDDMELLHDELLLEKQTIHEKMDNQDYPRNLPTTAQTKLNDRNKCIRNKLFFLNLPETAAAEQKKPHSSPAAAAAAADVNEIAASAADVQETSTVAAPTPDGQEIKKEEGTSSDGGDNKNDDDETQLGDDVKDGGEDGDGDGSFDENMNLTFESKDGLDDLDDSTSEEIINDDEIELSAAEILAKLECPVCHRIFHKHFGMLCHLENEHGSN